MSGKFYSTVTLAEALNTSKRTVRRMEEDGRLGRLGVSKIKFKGHRKWMFWVPDVDAVGKALGRNKTNKTD